VAPNGLERSWTPPLAAPRRELTSSRLAAALVTSALFAGVHAQYSWSLRALIFASAAAGCWVLLKQRSLWPAWIGHQVVDVLGDSVFFG
jgi:membrane protease YdiL (CAAX protease family)